MLTTLHLNEKSKEVCIKAKSPAASEETAFSMTKVYFNANNEQSGRTPVLEEAMTSRFYCFARKSQKNKRKKI